MISFAGEESRSTGNTRGSLEFPEGARSHPCLPAQPARLASPFPAHARPARLPGGAWLPSLGSTAAGDSPAGLSQDSTQRALDPAQAFPALMKCHTLCFSPTSAAVQNSVCSLACFEGILTAGYWFQCVCGSPQPWEGGEICS